MIMIGKVEDSITDQQIVETLRGVALPQKDVPGRHSVEWTKRAAHVLQGMGAAEQFDLDALEAAGITHADETMAMIRKGPPRPGFLPVYNFTKRPL